MKKIIDHEQFITDGEGKVQYVVLPASDYEKLVGALEDYGMALAMKVDEEENFYNKAEALKFLEND